MPLNTPVSAVDLWPAARALAAAAAAAELARVTLAANAPPAFLLDADRRGTRTVAAGDFDNRSVSLTTDFPSAATLGGAGISRVLLISQNRVVAADLSHTLRFWQQAGMRFFAIDPTDQSEQPMPLQVPRPSGFAFMLQRLLAVAGLRSSPFGGFGATLPLPSAG